MSSENISSPQSSPVNSPIEPDAAQPSPENAEPGHQTDANTPSKSSELGTDSSNVQPASSSLAQISESGSCQPINTNIPSSAKGVSATPSEEKIEIILKATGDAPIMKKTKWNVVRSRTVGWVAAFIKKYSHLQETDTLFLYVNQSYAPAPDELLDNLYCCFGAENKLVLHYSRTQAWG